MTVHSGALRLATPGDGEIVDITPGVVRVLSFSDVDFDDRPRDSTVLVDVLS